LSTKEEALKKAMELKEEMRFRGDDLQQLVEGAVRKALGETQKEEGSPKRPVFFETEHHPEGRAAAGEIFPKESGRSLQWHQAIDSIAVNIKIKLGEGKKGAVLFTSSVSGEGTTTVCSNVSRALAKFCPGNILLLDCNALHPEIHRLFRTESGPGLTDILMGKIHWEDAVRKSNVRNFYVLPFGQPLQEPLSLLGSEGMGRLLNVLKTNFDFILIDSPPILQSTEAELIAPWVEGVVLVINAHTTRREVVMRAAERMIQQKEFLGAVFNQQEFIIPQFLYKRLK
jgi:capsular exopolysaccharide synthesis family protein